MSSPANCTDKTNHFPSAELVSGQKRTEENDSKQFNKPTNGKESWIYSTFKKRTCGQFIPSKKEITRCCCGRLHEDHESEATRHILSSDVTWDISQHTIEEPTNAYGELEFTGAGQTSRAKFIRISDDTDPEKVLQVLRYEWKLELPKLLISVTGGAKSFQLHPKLKNVLRQGLLKAAQTTGAWIITGGTNTGVMRHVGEAVKGHTVMSRGAQIKDKPSQLHLIGIATWGIVEHRSDLINSNGVVTYHMTSSFLSEGACLDNNHSHFILVDDGREGKYGGEIPFRASLQNCITTKKISRSKSHGIPVVLLVLEGGTNTILTVLESVTSCPAVPVVIAEGSGRAADILAHAHNLVSSNNGTDMEDMADVVEHQQLLMKIQKAFPECNEQTCLSVYRDVLKCVGNKRYITIFRMDEDGVNIDRAILRALLKAQNASAADQLSLALIWNRADIAKTEIFTDNQKWELESLEDAMMDALINNRVEFVKLLLEKGISMGKFLTTTRLVELYKARWHFASSVIFRQVIGIDKGECGLTLADVNSAVRRLLGATYKGHGKDYRTLRTALGMANSKMLVDGHVDKMSDANYVSSPYKELLLWSVLCNMQKMALFMWERGEENLARALVAGKLLNMMAKLSERDDAKADVTDELYGHVDEFKRMALGLLDQCFQTNEELTQQLLTYNLESWGGQSCLSLAVAIEHEEFLAHVSCQTLLTEIWTGAMKSAHRSSIKTMMGLLFPPSIFFLEFKTKRELLSMPVTLEEHEQSVVEMEGEGDSAEENKAFRYSRTITEGSRGMELRTFSEPKFRSASSIPRDFRRIPNHQDWRQETRVVHLRWGKKLLEFYKAPVTKFWSNVFAYLVFLALFSYVILIRQDKIPSISEMVLIIFVCTLCTEEIRQILHSEPPTLKNKFKEWASSKWNILDGFAVVSFFVGLGLRLFPVTRSAGHVVYCFDVMLWIVRLLDIFSVSKHMGPYVVMIGRMTIDMLYFLLIMVVFLLAYGVAQQAILHPNEEPSWSVVTGVFFRPYFQVYGELFVETPDTIDNNTTLFGTSKKDEHADIIVAFIVAFYLLVANILLLNLLIAIFNNTYNSVQANANQIWKFQRYYLVMEYAQRPVLVPPFIILNHVIHLIKGIYRRLRKCCRLKTTDRQDSTRSYGLKLFLGRDDLQKMSLFEERCVDGYLREKDTLLHATQEEKIRVIGDRMETVCCQLQDMYKESISQSNSNKKAISSLDTRLTKLEEHTHRIVGLLERLQVLMPPETETLTNSDEHKETGRTVSLSDIEVTGSSHAGRRPSVSRRGSGGTVFGTGTRFKSKSESENGPLTNQPELEGHTRRRLSTVAARAKETAARRSSSNQSTKHVRARQSPYPNSDQQRYPVPDFLITWQGVFPGYDPPLYTAVEVQASLLWADVDILQKTSSAIIFNCVENGINRRSYTGLIDVVNRLPRNPVGRTGIAGRGLFGRWGPNHAAHLVATRWKEDEDGKTIQKEGKNVLEFVAVRRPDIAEWSVPGGLVNVGDSISVTLKKVLDKKILPALKPTFSDGKENLDESLNFMIQNAVEVYKGYVDDPRNTDNAWMETVVLNFHDEPRNTLCDFEFEAREGIRCVKWEEVSSHINLQVNYHLILKKVAELRKAYF